MITIQKLVELHAKKLAETKNAHEAFIHSHWRAFEAGIAAAGGQVTSKFKEQFGIDDEWVIWDGATDFPAQITPGTKVFVRFTDLEETPYPITASNFRWEWKNFSDDIIAYKVSENVK